MSNTEWIAVRYHVAFFFLFQPALHADTVYLAHARRRHQDATRLHQLLRR
jgi:hypothetical protein